MQNSKRNHSHNHNKLKEGFGFICIQKKVFQDFFFPCFFSLKQPICWEKHFFLLFAALKLIHKKIELSRVVTTEGSPSGRPCPLNLYESKPCPSKPCYKWVRTQWTCDLQVFEEKKKDDKTCLFFELEKNLWDDSFFCWWGRNSISKFIDIYTLWQKVFFIYLIWQKIKWISPCFVIYSRKHLHKERHEIES